MSVTVSLVDDNLEEILRASEEQIHAALEECAVAGEAYAVAETNRLIYSRPPSPSGYVRTGNLRTSISHAVQGDEAIIGTNIEYAPYVHFGARGTPPKPFLKNAITRHLPYYKQVIKNHLEG